MNSDSKNRELKKEYRLTHRRMGVYQIRSLVNDKVFVGSSMNLDAIFNRLKFQLRMGNYWNKELQQDWNREGGDNFVFEILDELTPNNDSERSYQEDLSFLEELWVERLEPFDSKGYNVRKLSREEKLRKIAESRRSDDS